MRSKQDNDVSTFHWMTAESTPTCLTSKWESCKSSQWEHLSPPVLKDGGNIFTRIIVIELIRTRAISKQGVIICETFPNQFISNQFVCFWTFKISWEMLLKWFFCLICQLIWNFVINGFHNNSWLVIEYLFEYVLFFLILLFQTEFKWKESIWTFSCHVYHYSTNYCKLALFRHPIIVENGLDELLKKIKHSINQSNLFIFMCGYFMNMWNQKMFDAVHLVILIAWWKVSACFVSLDSSQSSYCCTTSWWNWRLTFSFNFSNNSLCTDTNVWSKEDDNIAILSTMTTKCAPSCFTSKWKSCQTSKWEYLTPPVLKQRSNIF